MLSGFGMQFFDGKRRFHKVSLCHLLAPPSSLRRMLSSIPYLEEAFGLAKKIEASILEVA
jgi:hypothetical protein